MEDRARLIRSEIVELIKGTVQESMGPFGLKAVNVQSGEDHDGDPVIFVEAEYDLSDTPIDTAVTAKLTSILRDRLWAADERRFPHIRHKFDEKQKIKPRHRARA